MSAITAAARDSSVIARRNLINVLRTPGALVTGIVQPVMFVLLLGFVFGGTLGGDQYRSFLIGGILAQTLTFNASFTAVYLAKDLQMGLIDRFRSLPMSRVAVILGRTTSDLSTSILSVIVTLACGLAIGWRITTGPAAAIGALALLLLFAFAVSWIGAVIALTARSVEVAQSLGLVWLFPVTFVSGAFVSPVSLPGALRPIAEWNPVTAVATAARELFGNAAPSGFGAPGGWPAENAVLYSVLCSIGIIGVFAPLAIAQYRRISKR